MMAYGYDQPREKGRTKSLEPALKQLVDWANKKNVADDLEDDQLNEIGSDVVREYEIDLTSLDRDWETKIIQFNL